jgi:hypothetical protein
MFITNPFAELSATVPPAIVQAYVTVTAILVVIVAQSLTLLRTYTLRPRLRHVEDGKGACLSHRQLAGVR